MFDTFTASLSNSVLSIFGVDAVYTPVSGGAVSCRINIVQDAELRPDGLEMQIYETGTTIEGKISDIGEPKIGSYFIVGTATYIVKRLESKDSVFVKVVVKES